MTLCVCACVRACVRACVLFDSFCNIRCQKIKWLTESHQVAEKKGDFEECERLKRLLEQEINFMRELSKSRSDTQNGCVLLAARLNFRDLEESKLIDKTAGSRRMTMTLYCLLLLVNNQTLLHHGICSWCASTRHSNSNHDY